MADERRVGRNGLQVAGVLADFIETEALPGSGVGSARFWEELAALIADMAPRNRALLEKRAALQEQIDDWFRKNGAHGEGQEAFLREIGYLVDEGPAFSIDTDGIDAEIARIAGPQLVVPVTNARFAVNAANARWGSLYDALYGTDALGQAPAGSGFDPARAASVIAWVRDHLDRAAPLAGGTWAGVRALDVRDGGLVLENEGGETTLADPSGFAGFVRDAAGVLTRVILRRHGLHLILDIDPETPVGALDAAGIADVILESALSVIMDCEDSVVAVDAAEKVGAYRNWLGLMQGELSASFVKNGRDMWRRLADDIAFTAPDGSAREMKGRALMLVRNVGHLMTTPAVLDSAGNEVPEGLLDAMVTTLIACHDLRRKGGPVNSPAGSVYVVKPKMHGPEEVAFCVDSFERVERALGLAPNTVKLGIMDEERRTSANLAACIRAARRRLAFINTGFLDRTGDEIHTGMEAGPMVRKGAMKDMPWIRAYEDRNVDIGLACGLRGKAQIGKGMWARPARMAEMLAQKIAHPEAGANCAWVPSPTAATLHATHYHLVDVAARQDEIARQGPRASLADLLRVPVGDPGALSPREITDEIENNAQGILGYVVRWVDLGVGCSTVPDIHDVGLMEDRATCRISSQALANWLYHSVVDEQQVMAAMRRMAEVVDRQNASDPLYRPMAPGFDGAAFRAACDLVFKGREQPSGYTEPILHSWRLRLKADRAG